MKPKGTILDIGCGEGVFVEELRKKGFKIEGVDANYSSDLVRQGDVLDLPFSSQSYETVLLLDVIEHLNLTEQRLALREITRVLKTAGTLIISVPNLAHLYSRIEFLLKGKLIRTAAPAEKHPGDRPIREYIQLLKQEGYDITLRKGFFLTLPFCFKWIQRKPGNFMWLYHFLNYFAVPNWCFLNILLCRRINDSSLRE